MSTAIHGAVISITALTKLYGSIKAVENLSLTVQKGGIFGLLGPNGSGKTTTMGMLLGFVEPTAGSFRLLGHTGGGPAVLPRIGAIVENSCLLFLSIGKR